VTQLVAQAEWVAQFEGRYGDGAFERLLTDLRQPCLSFAEIAASFAVTRECVRRWHRTLLPDAPTGHERQRLCAQYHRRRRLFQDPLFRAFFRHARERFPPGRVEPIPAKDGYRTRTVRIDTRTVALREGQSMVRYRGAADFVYVRVGTDGFLFLPSGEFPAAGLSVSSRGLAAYDQYRNSFTALTHGPGTASPECVASAAADGITE
jgi:hypothetical protein